MSNKCAGSPTCVNERMSGKSRCLRHYELREQRKRSPDLVVATRAPQGLLILLTFFLMVVSGFVVYFFIEHRLGHAINPGESKFQLSSGSQRAGRPGF